MSLLTNIENTQDMPGKLLSEVPHKKEDVKETIGLVLEQLQKKFTST